MSGKRPSVTADLDRQYVRQVGRLADHLRRFADRVERIGGEIEDHHGRARHVLAVADIVSELNAMFGNSPMWNLIAAADDAQREHDRTAEPTP